MRTTKAIKKEYDPPGLYYHVYYTIKSEKALKIS
jgi:hypothetical protein